MFGDIRDDFWVAIRDGSDPTAIALRSRLEEAGARFLDDVKAPSVAMRTRG